MKNFEKFQNSLAVAKNLSWKQMWRRDSEKLSRHASNTSFLEHLLVCAGSLAQKDKQVSVHLLTLDGSENSCIY